MTSDGETMSTDEIERFVRAAATKGFVALGTYDRTAFARLSPAAFDGCTEKLQGAGVASWSLVLFRRDIEKVRAEIETAIPTAALTTSTTAIVEASALPTSNDLEPEAPREVPEGITELLGADAAHEARRTAREAERCGAPDPLDGLVERMRATGDTALALDPLVVSALADLQARDAPAFDEYRRAYKAAGGNLGLLDGAVRAAAREARKAQKDREKRRGVEAFQQRLAQREKERAALVAERQRAREQAAAELTAHYADATRDDVSFSMSPGRVISEEPGRRPTDEPRVFTLANFSAPIVAEVLELSTPDAAPARTFVLSVMVEGDSAPRRVDVPANSWARGDWPDTLIGARASVSSKPGARDLLREALRLLSRAEVQRRYGFTGWTFDGARWLYAHAAGGIGEAGALAGVDVAVQGIGAKYALPAPLEGPALLAALDVVLAFARLEPASVVVPLFAAVFRAPLGPSKATVHVTGRPGLGKTLLCTVASRFFGPAVEALSWADGSTANGIMQNLRTVGDALVVVDDLKVSGTGRDEGTFRLADQVIRAQFNRAAPSKGRREGGLRDTSASRCLLVSTGEVIPSSHSGVWRMLSLGLDVEVDVDAVVPILRAAERGELAGLMAAYLRWLAPRIADTRARLVALERDAAFHAGIDPRQRTGALAAELALGLDTFAAFLADVAPALSLRFELAAARAALALAVGAQGSIVAGEDPARRFGPMLGEALRSGAAHVVAINPAGASATPETPSLWGWRYDGEWKRLGPCIGYIRGGELAIEPGPALRVVRDLAQRSGRPLALEERTLGRDLHAAGVLARDGRDTGRSTYTVQFRIGGGARVPTLVLNPSALGMELDAAPGAPEAAAAAPDDTEPARDGDEFEV